MYASIIAALAASTFAVAAPVAERDTPSTYAEGYLEPYAAYHTRYLAIGCTGQHGSDFFEQCCHPLLATETLEANRPAYCAPNATVAAAASSYVSSIAADPATTTTAVADAAAESDYSAPSSVTSVWTTSTKAAEKEKATSTSPVAYQAPAASAAAPAAPAGDVKTGGFATYFYQGGNAGACGTVHSDYDMGIAIDTSGYWQNTGSASPYCGKWINIKNTNNGKTVSAQVWDACPSCVSDNSLDLSVGAFNAIASESDGMVPITWSWA